MPDAWRIVPHHRVASAFDGEGARLFGGRWNAPGRPAVYTAESRALAALEVLVHLTPESSRRRFALIRIRLPQDAIAGPDGGVPRSHAVSAQIHPDTQRAGDAWLASRETPALRVPSAVVPGEFNFLLNPLHPAFGGLKADEPEPFAFDPRLLPEAGAD